jgi:glycosyltransferase involved in cell wall biosynthesis
MIDFNYVGPINGTGYGIASSNYLCQLLNLDIKIGFKPIGNIDPNIVSEIGFDSAKLQKSLEDFNPLASTFCFWHFHDIGSKLNEITGPKIAFSTFETDGLRPHEAHSLTSFDRVTTASSWGNKILAKYLPSEKLSEPIPHAFMETENSSRIKVPLLKDPWSFWRNAFEPLILSNPLVLSTAGKFEARKGHPELFHACNTFSKQTSRPVVLLAPIFNPFILDHYPYDYLNKENYYSVFTHSGMKVYKKNNFYIALLPRTATRNQLFSTLSKSHLFISPSKAEGWNLPLFELMSQGMLCAASLNTAHLDYVSLDSVIEVEADRELPMIPAFDGRFFDGTFSWHNITSASILSSLYNATKALEDSSKVETIVSNAINQTSNFSWQNSAKKIVSLMKSL